MLFDDVFYPGNPERRQRVADLQGEIKGQFNSFKQAWNDTVDLINDAFSKVNQAPYNKIRLIRVNYDIQVQTVSEAVQEINNVTKDANGKLAKLVSDIGLSEYLPSGWETGDLKLDFDPDSEVAKKIGAAISGTVAAVAGAIASWYAYSGVTIFILLVNSAGAGLTSLLAIASGALAGLIIGSTAFVVTDLIVSAITGAIERDQLEDAIDALEKLKTEVGDKIAEAAIKVSGVYQTIKDGMYKLDDKHILIKVGEDNYQVIVVPNFNTISAVPNIAHLNVVRRLDLA